MTLALTDPLEGANCHWCGQTADNFHVTDELWAKVEPTLGQSQACFKCFRIAAWHAGVRPDPGWQVSLWTTNEAGTPKDARDCRARGESLSRFPLRDRLARRIKGAHGRGEVVVDPRLEIEGSQALQFSPSRVAESTPLIVGELDDDGHLEPPVRNRDVVSLAHTLFLRVRRNWWYFALGLHQRIPGWTKRSLQGWLANRYIRSYFDWEKATKE